MGCYLAEYRARVSIWAAMYGGGAMTPNSGPKVPGNCRKRVMTGLRMIILSTTTLAMLLVIGGVELNPGPCTETEKITRVLCNGCDITKIRHSM